MAKKETEKTILKSIKGSVGEETKKGILAIIFFVLAAFFVLAYLGKGGTVGIYVYNIFTRLLGNGPYFLLPIILISLSISFFRSMENNFGTAKIIGSTTLLLSLLGVINIIFPDKAGFLGNISSYPFVKLFDNTASLVFLGAISVISLLIAFETRLAFGWVSSIFSFKKYSDEKETKEPIIINSSDAEPEDKNPSRSKNEQVEAGKSMEEKPSKLKIQDGTKKEKISDSDFSIKTQFPSIGIPFNPPPLSLLERDSGKPGVGDIKANANIIKRTLQNFGIIVEMDEISIGPSVTRYALKPAEGVKLSRIVALQNDLSLALAAHPIRIEAPIPGKSLVGIEIPNHIKTTVGLGSLLSNEEFQNSTKPLFVSLGKGISGKSHFANLAKMPHLLIAGATGSGKSVTIPALITSLLYRNSPENLKFIMIDPKRVELTLYNKIPHLLTPVITDAKKTILALKWAAKEMDRRYDILQAESVRDIESYHKSILTPELKKLEKTKDANGQTSPEESAKLPDPMPYIVIIIDELADIMQTYPRELESAIVRLAQMSRAVGIHLMLSTQRPSVNVITGLIKANIPARIALQVASQIDSRTILDMSGAEKLLGAGDMLYLSGEMSKPSRIQSAYITEGEVKKVVKYLTDSYQDEIPNEINFTPTNTMDKNTIFESSFGSDDTDLGDDDELYEQAKGIVIEAGKASTSYIQRKLRVGYARAARLVDLLEQRGVVGPADGSKPRSVVGNEQTSEKTEDTTQVGQVDEPLI